MDFTKWTTSSGLLKRSAPQEVKQAWYEHKIYNKHGDNVILIGVAGKVADKHTFRCINGHTWTAQLNSITSGGRGCPHCSNKVKLTKEKAIDSVCKVSNGNIRMLTYPTHTADTVTFKGTCGHTWITQYNNVANRGSGCPVCAGNITKTQEQAVLDITKTHGGSILVLGSYKSSNSPMLLQCKCGHTWNASYSNVVGKGSGCPTCAGRDHNVIYFWRLGNTNIYKVGITKDIYSNRRIKAVANSYNVEPKILVYRKTKDCKEIESIIKENYSEFKADISGDGHTEMLDLTHEQALEIQELIEIL